MGNTWQPIETAKADRKLKVLYFPPKEDSYGRNLLNTYYEITTNPDPFPRKATHWILLPKPPKVIEAK